MEIRPEEFLSFFEWLLTSEPGTANQPGRTAAIVYFLVAVPVVMAVSLFVCYLAALRRHSPGEAFYSVATVVARAISRDLPSTRLGRILAIARLTVKEAIRRKVIVVFIVFSIILLFAGWFLDTESTDPAQLYISFVLTTTNFLTIMLALLLSAFSIPTDIKTKTIYTIVTKPVRATEVVLGRIFGFAFVISVLLALMCFTSYVFVVRGLSHEHQVDMRTVERVDGVLRGVTTRDSFHRHEFEVDESFRMTEESMGHIHSITENEDGSLTVGQPEGMLQARVPVFGTLRFNDRDGNPVDKGINVGKEWSYRSYVEGQTLHTAIWTFEGLTPERFPDGLPLDLTLGVFRTFKGDIETGIRGVILVTNPNVAKGVQSEPISFVSQEYTTQRIVIPRKIRPFGASADSEEELDLFDDLVDEGKLEIWLRCDDAGQYFGVAQADVYVAARNAPFWWNFVKGYIGIWLQMLLVTSLGVMFSTFLSTPVAILATLSTVLVGYNDQFITDLLNGTAVGGGPVESLIKLGNQQPITAELDVSPLAKSIVQWIDFVFMAGMKGVAAVLPNFDEVGRMTSYVAHNMNVYGDLLTRNVVTTFVYVLGISLIGYFFLRTREIAA